MLQDCARPYFLPIWLRSGPTVLPSPPARWQLLHCDADLLKNNALPRPASPFSVSTSSGLNDDAQPLDALVRRQEPLEQVARPARPAGSRRQPPPGRGSLPANAARPRHQPASAPPPVVPSNCSMRRQPPVRLFCCDPNCSSHCERSSSVRQLSDPLLDQPQARLVHELRADVRHPAAAQLGHAVVEHRAVRVAGGDDLGVRRCRTCPGPAASDAPSSVPAADVEEQLNVRRAAGAELVAVRSN